MNHPIATGGRDDEGRGGKRGTKKNPGVQKQFREEDGQGASKTPLQKNNFV